MSDQEGRYDWILRGAEIVDGTGAPRYRGDLAIQGQIIAALGNLDKATGDQEIDASAKIICPGFVDVHTHSDLRLLSHPMNEAKLRQGVTTEILGLDGVSHFPASPRTQSIINDLWGSINGRFDLGNPISSIEDIITALNGHTAVNTAFLVPHLTVRIEVMGLVQRPATASEIKAMREIVRLAMEQGAIGLSTGLNYWPANYATTEELIALCEVVAAWGGVYVTHLRDYRDLIVEAIDEAARIGKAATIPVHISHLNHQARTVLPPIEKALEEGVDLTFDHYPYLVGHTLLAQFLPRWAFVESSDKTFERLAIPANRERLRDEFLAQKMDWSKYRFCSVPVNGGEAMEGLSLSEVAERNKKDAIDLICDLLVSAGFAITVLVTQTYRTEEDYKVLMRHPAQMFATDAIYIGGHVHPRAFGTYPKILREYVCREGLLTWEEAINKMTSVPAERFGFSNRGELQKGLAADILLIDPDNVGDLANYDHPSRLSKGIEFIWVNGELVLSPDGLTNSTPGHTQRRMMKVH